MSAVLPEDKTKRILWQDYLFLSRELNKFASPDDYELFWDLLGQREKLQPMIEAAPDTENYQKSDEFQVLVKQIMALNDSIAERLRFYKNAALKQRNLANAYDGYGGDFAAGYRMDERR